MGVYNPHIPRILGQEFCPIREEGITFSPSVNVVELGHTFTLATARSMTDVRYYIKTLPPGWAGNQVYTASIYPAGLEDKTGPIHSVIIPCNQVDITGSAGAVVAGAGTFLSQLQSPSDNGTIRIEPSFDTGSKAIDMFFATNAYASLLQGKRIVGVNFVFQLSIDPSANGPLPAATIDAPSYQTSQELQYYTGSQPVNAIGLNYAPLVGGVGNGLWYLNPAQGGPASVTQLQKVELGDINYLWNTPSVARTADKMPWRYSELQRFEATSGVNRTKMHFQFGATNQLPSGTQEWGGFWYLGYAALEVLYCEEQRVAYGGRDFGVADYSSFGVDYVYGANIIPLRDPTTFVANPVLPAGQYSVVVASADIGDFTGPFSFNDRTRRADANTYPTLNALRELYALSSHTGVQVNVTQTEGETFTEQETLVLPQLSIHASGGPLTEVHVYGKQVLAQVYGSITASQDIYDSGLTAASYPQVRFYARRFGATTVPLTLSSPTISGIGQSVNITPAQWDALDPIIDGWKEVTLRFPTAPSMGSGTNPLWVWSAASETKGNRWEVLGAMAPALSGIPGSWLNLVPSPNQLGVATYGAPSAGTNINMNWYPGPLTDESTQSTYFSVRDTFTRVTANGWGTADTGQVWTIFTGTASEFLTNGTDARQTHTATNANHSIILGITPQADFDYRINDDSTLAAAPLTQDFVSFHDLRYLDQNNSYRLVVRRKVANTITIEISKILAGVTTILAGPTVVAGVVPANNLVIRFQVIGSTLQAKGWLNASTEPTAWLISATDTSITAPGSVRVSSFITTGNTNTLPQSNVFDNLSLANPLDDLNSDAVLLFSQDPPAISGFSITQLNQALTGIGLNCGITPQFIPSALAYNQLAWSVDQGNIASDTFTRTSSSSWGVATSGQTWTATGGSATDFNVNNGVGKVTISTVNAYRIVRMSTAFSVRDVDAYVEISSDTAAVTNDHWGSLFVRDNGSGDQWYGQVKFNPNGTVQHLLTSVASSVFTVLGTVTIAQTYTLGTKVKMRLQTIGSLFRGKAWMDGEVEPADWQIQATSSDNNAAGQIGTRTIGGTGTPATTVVSYDNLLISSTSNGYTELQRMDTITDWQTIMKAYHQNIASFNDYEARVAVLSSYRIRYVNVYGFAGPWSATVTITITTPGVTVTGAVENVWIFTTNALQNGSSNLAYCLGWEGEVSESFNFPEAAGQTYQTVYGRDFVTVFRPEERGGTNFARNLLVQAAAISPETLENFVSLRNMAWADVPYICLRDEEGNRWFSNVSVPSGNVLRNRRLYMAPVSIIEVTDTADPVNP